MTAPTMAVTGWAWRTPLGDQIPGVFERLCAGARACAPRGRFPLEAYPVRWVAAIPGEPAPTRHGRFLRRMGLFALEVASEALADARPATGGQRLGLFFGYGGLRAHWQDMLPALSGQAPDGRGSWQRGLHLLHPFWMLQHLSNNAQALAAQGLGARGDGLTLGGGNAGAQALAAAARALAAGAIDAAVVAGYDTLLEPENLVELAGRGAYPGEADQPPPAPYDAQAAGFVPGEAAAAVVLERPATAGPRARVLLQAWDAADGQRGEPDEQSLAALLADALGPPAAAPPFEIVDGAARGVLALDRAERNALGRYTGSAARSLPICATLASMGQLGAASSLVQAIGLGSALTAGRLPPIACLRRATEGPLQPLGAVTAIAARSALAISTAAPGLMGLVRVALP